MWLIRRGDTHAPDRTTSDMLERIQRLEHEQAELRARVESERRIRIFVAQIVGAAQVATVTGRAVEAFADAMRTPLRRERAGGLARSNRVALFGWHLHAGVSEV